MLRSLHPGFTLSLVILIYSRFMLQSPLAGMSMRECGMNIGEVAKACGLPVKTVRYYDDIGLISPRQRSTGGYRQYDKTGLSKLIFVRRARAFGFSIEETRELLSLYEDQDRSSADVKRIAWARLREIDRRMVKLEALRTELDHLVEACRGDHRPDCPILSGLSSVPN